ncbi:hypothetical protein D3C87_40250 [compost metagenome]
MSWAITPLIQRKLMKIESQSAETIINVAGSLNNSGELKIENLYLNASGDETVNFIKPDQDYLRAQFSVDYLNILESDFEQKKLIPREAISEIEKLLNENSEVAIIGRPGVGKTTLLYELSKRFNSVIYFNVKGKSTKTVVLHLLNKICLSNNQPLLSLNDVDAALEMLQYQLQNSNITFFLDECEASDETISKILNLRKGKNRFLYATQSDVIFQTPNISIYPLENFTRAEAELFLEIYNIKLDVLGLNELFDASQCNALYLFYFSQYNITPLPQGIENYHSAIWKSLSNEEQETLIYLAISYFPMTIKELASVRGLDNMIEVTNSIKKSRLVTIGNEGHLEVFHPSFKNFIINELESYGTLQHYQGKLGSLYLENGNLIQATYLLLDHGPDSIESFGFDVLPLIINKGDFELANRLIIKLLERKRSALIEGYLKFHLSLNLRYLHQQTEADEMGDEALKLLKKSKNKRLYTSALMSKAIDLIDRGDTTEGLKLANKIVEEDDKSDEQYSGQLLVSLSKIYVDLFQHEKAANASKKAYELFAKIKEEYGLFSSLSNLASSLSMMDDYKDLAETYALKLLETSSSSTFFGVELIALNVLTSLNRQWKNIPEAKKYGHKAVLLCQRYKLEQRVVLNLVNYGNIFRDNNEIDQAISIYEEALTLATELNLKREIARIYWIISNINFEKGNIPLAIEQIDKSIDLSNAMNYDYGSAHAYEERGEILEEIEDFANAGESFERSFHVFLRMGNMTRYANRVLTKSILNYAEANELKQLDKLVKLSLNSVDSDQFIDLSGITEHNLKSFDIHQYIEQLTLKSVESINATNNISSYLSYLKHCKKDSIQHSKYFKKVVLLLAKNISHNEYIKTSLGILIEQSDKLLNYEDIKEVIALFGDHELTFFYRETQYDLILQVCLVGGFSFEIICYKDELTTIKIALCFILFLFAIPNCFQLEREKKEDFVRITLILKSTLETVIPKLPKINFDDDVQSAIIVREKPTDPVFVCINDDYPIFSDLSRENVSRCNMFLIRSLYDQLITHYYQVKSSTIRKSTKPISQIIANFYDLTDIALIEKSKIDYQVDLSYLTNNFKN